MSVVCRAVFVLIASSFWSRLVAQGILTGAVTDSNKVPIAGVEILVEGTHHTTRTNVAGLYRLLVPSGSQTAFFRAVGYKPLRLKVELRDHEAVYAAVVMIRQGIQELDTVVVQAPPARVARTLREGFDERRALALGKFVDSTELRRSDARTTADVLSGLGVRMIPYAECNNMSCPKQYRAASPTGGACWVSVVYNGQIIYRSGRGGEPPDFLKEFRPFELESIEYYRGSATIPLEFSGIGEQCGVLVLWSRRR
ncbi:MAG TPA: carboxypeptidase-like regulatory domain-containing protein [Gemmatimonadaceae bacterium]|nr:carboxypeptidase-like regulatory domain-containing protein [Gemmatimonadaceae bacterium]